MVHARLVYVLIAFGVMPVALANAGVGTSLG
jgi:hypothetical protein